MSAIVNQGWSISYTPANGSAVTIGGSGATHPIYSRHALVSEYRAARYVIDFLCQGSSFGAFAADVQAVTAAMRQPRGRLQMTLGGSTVFLDFNPEIDASTPVTSQLAFDAEVSFATLPAEPNSGQAEMHRLTIRFKRPSDLAGQGGRDIHASARKSYVVKRRMAAEFVGVWTATPAVQPPQAALVAADGGAGAMGAGTFKYWHTDVDWNGIESGPSPLASITQLASHQVALSGITDGSSTNVAFHNIYRSLANGSSGFLLPNGHLAFGTTTLADDNTDAALSGQPALPAAGATAGQTAIQAYENAQTGADVYARAWLSANVTLPGGSTWALFSNDETPTDSGYELAYRRVYMESVGGRLESLTRVSTLKYGAREVTISSAWISTQGNTPQSAEQNYLTNCAGFCNGILDQALDGATSNHANYDLLKKEVGPEDKQEYLTATWHFLEVVFAQNSNVLNDPVVVEDQVHFDLDDEQPGYSPDALGGGSAPASSGGGANQGGGANGQTATKVPALTQTTSGGQPPANGSPGGAGGLVAHPLMDVAIRYSATLNVVALAGQDTLSYWKNSLRAHFLQAVQKRLHITIATDPKEVVSDGASRSEINVLWRCKAIVESTLACTMSTAIPDDPGDIYTDLMGGNPHVYLHQDGPPRRMKLRVVDVVILASGKYSPQSFVLGRHQDASGGMWLPIGPQTPLVKNLTIGNTIKMRVTQVHLVQRYLYASQLIEGSIGSGSAQGAAAGGNTGGGPGAIGPPATKGANAAALPSAFHPGQPGVYGQSAAAPPPDAQPNQATIQVGF